MSAEIGRKYQHFKGGIYTVLLIAAHADTKEPFVVYSKDDAVQIFVRPLVDWEKPVTISGNLVPRFARIEKS